MQDGERKIPIHAYIFRILYIDAGWWEDDTFTSLGQKVKSQIELCQHFSADTITIE